MFRRRLSQLVTRLRRLACRLECGLLLIILVGGVLYYRRWSQGFLAVEVEEEGVEHRRGQIPSLTTPPDLPPATFDSFINQLKSIESEEICFRDVKTAGESTRTWSVSMADAVAVYAVQGLRPHMEDRFCFRLSPKESEKYFGLFDGHGGTRSVEIVEKTVLSHITERLTKDFGGELSRINWTQVLSEEILRVDRELAELSPSDDVSGSTALVAIISGSKLVVANVGDSRGVLATRTGEAIALSRDHKANDELELELLKQRGGWISFFGVWRVVGVLAMTRALGDHFLKTPKPYVIALPDVYVFDLVDQNADFIILASDGLWDVVTNLEAVEFIRDRLNLPGYGTKELAELALSQMSADNISIMVIKLTGLKKVS